MLIILKRDFKEMRRSNAFLLMVILISIAAAAVIAGIGISLVNKAWLLEADARPVLTLIISLVVYFLPFFIIISFIWAFSSLPVIKEKANGNIANLLATPMKPWQFWIGKSMAIFLPGYVISLIYTLIVLVAINLIIISRPANIFIPPVPLILTGLVVNPLLFFCLILFIIFLSLVSGSQIAIAPSFIAGFGLMMGIPLGIMTGVIDLASWSFCLWYALATVACIIGIFFLSSRLTKENVILSGTES